MEREDGFTNFLWCQSVLALSRVRYYGGDGASFSIVGRDLRCGVEKHVHAYGTLQTGVEQRCPMVTTDLL